MMDASGHAMSAEEVLLREDREGTTTLTLNRPSHYNALSENLLGALQSALDSIATDARVRVVVLAGSGKAFCAGHDLREMREHPSKAYQRALFDRCSRVMLTLARLPQPVIARVHGIATAAGYQLVAAADLAVASRAARFAVSGVNVGLFCGTPSVALGRVVARKQALEMLLTGTFIDADAALARGLVNHVVEPDTLDAAVAALAASIVAKAPAVIASGKRMYYEQLEMGVSAAYDYASEYMASSMMEPDAHEGIDAFLQKRTPLWRGEPPRSSAP